MAQCTAPVRGHNSAAAAAACPACRYRYGRGYGYSGGNSSPSYHSYSSSASSGSSSGSSGGRSSGGSRPRWSRTGSTVFYTPAQVQSLTPVREAVERVAVQQPDLRDCFLCHAWPDRQGAAKDLDDALKAAGLARGGKDGVRLLAKGEFTSKASFAVAGASAGASAAVEAAGGSIELPAAKASEHEKKTARREANKAAAK